MENKNKIALVTGGSRGLGRNMVTHIAHAGIDVIFTYNSNRDEAEKVASELVALGVRAEYLQLNTAEATGLSEFIARLKEVLIEKFHTERFDYLVNNAGVGLYNSIAETTEEQFDTLFNIHLKSVFFLTQKSLELLNDGGAIVNISTGLARFSLPGYAAYASMKGAIETFTRYLAKELGVRGIRANSVAPGAIATDFGGGRVRDNADLNKMVASTISMGRVGLPDDIGPVVAFLCSDAAKWVTAQRIEVSGGQGI